MQQVLQAKITEANPGAEGVERPMLALGVVTHPISRSQFESITIGHDDAVEMASNVNVFLELVSKHTVVAAHRAIVDFANGLLLELQSGGNVSLDTSVVEKLHERRMSPKELTKTYEEIKLPLTTQVESHRKLHMLSETRNCIEHNGGRVNKKLAELARDPILVEGDPLALGTREMGGALALVGSLALSLDKRAASEFAE